jgi:hypothetical protein
MRSAPIVFGGADAYRSRSSRDDLVDDARAFGSRHLSAASRKVHRFPLGADQQVTQQAPRTLAALSRQPEPPALVLNEPSCYHFRVLDPRLPLWKVPRLEAHAGRFLEVDGVA